MLQFIILVVPSLNGVLNLNVHHHYYFISVMDGSYVFIKKSSYQEWRLNQCGDSHWSSDDVWISVVTHIDPVSWFVLKVLNSGLYGKKGPEQWREGLLY